MMMIFNWVPVARWAYGLIAAFIWGGASAVTSALTASVLAPETFNTGNQIQALLTLMGVTFTVNGLLSMFLYLRQAPLPEWDHITDRRTETTETAGGQETTRTERITTKTKV